MTKNEGTVKFFNSQKGFGFITPKAGGKDIFVHANKVAGNADDLREGTDVEYELADGQKGPEAINVRIL